MRTSKSGMTVERVKGYIKERCVERKRADIYTIQRGPKRALCCTFLPGASWHKISLWGMDCCITPNAPDSTYFYCLQANLVFYPSNIILSEILPPTCQPRLTILASNSIRKLKRPMLQPLDLPPWPRATGFIQPGLLNNGTGGLT